MKKLLVASSIILLALASAHATVYKTLVLNDGFKLTGCVMEEVPGKSVTIRVDTIAGRIDKSFIEAEERGYNEQGVSLTTIKLNAKGKKALNGINGKPVDSWNEFTGQIGVLQDMMTDAKTHQDSIKMRTVSLVYSHADNVDTAQVVLSPELLLGVGQTTIYTYYKPTKLTYSFFGSFPAGIKYGLNILRGYVNDLKYVATADGAKSLGGFGAIGSLFPPVWDWMMFWRMTAFLSIILAFMNILPIPALDGGHVLFLLYEIITGRKPSENFMIKAEYVGFTILILLMVVANLNDILRWLGYM